MDSWVGYQVGLELCQINIESSVEAERRSDRRHDLTDQSIEIGVSRSLNIEVSTTDIVYCFVVHHKSTIGMLQSGVGGQNGVVWLDNSCRNLSDKIE